ncbi:unnamed protein product [Nesidiocoris tenuis]|uniref:Discoidin domain-containing protein n=1 Tax=Nesidiocoris tenuis TaxID=355587 RepID=A0A6H5GG53_9HEMI|nr:unnamed protein product [Nesidiocoris tenuis]
MHLHTNNFFSKGVQVFSSAKVYLSIGGKLFSGLPIEYQYMPDTIMEHARNVTIKLHHVIGRFLKVQLYFESQWIMVSEVSFDSAYRPIGRIGRSSAPRGSNIPHKVEQSRTSKTCHCSEMLSIRRCRNTSLEKPVGSTEDSEKGILYHEPFASANMYGLHPTTRSAEYAGKFIFIDHPFCIAVFLALSGFDSFENFPDVPDIMQEYAVPLVSQPPSFYTSVPPQTPLRSLPPLHNFFPKPPPVPPPPEKYYAATEIVQKAPPVPSSPPPPSVSHSSSSASSSAYGQILHPPSSESRPSATADLQLNSIPRSDLKYLTKLGIGHFGEVSNFPLCE